MPKPQRQLGVTYSRVDLSHYRLYSAFFFMQHAEHIEETASQMANSNVVYRYRAFVMGAVFSSVAFLEAKLTELRSDAENGGGVSATGLTPAQRKAVDAQLDEARKGPYYGPFDTAVQAIKFLRKQVRRRNAIKSQSS